MMTQKLDRIYGGFQKAKCEPHGEIFTNSMKCKQQNAESYLLHDGNMPKPWWDKQEIDNFIAGKNEVLTWSYVAP